MQIKETQRVTSGQQIDHYVASDDVNLLEVFSMIWKGKFWVILFVTIGAAISIAYALNKPDIYTSQVVTVSASDESGSGSSLASQFGGLAGLAGISLGGGGGKLAVALEILQSRLFLINFINKYNVSIPLFATTAWDKASNAWVYDLEKYDPVSKKWLAGSKPSDLSVYRAFKNGALSVETSQKTGMVILSVSSQSPQYAQRWAELLVKEINEYIRNTEIEEANKSMEFLKVQLERTPIADMQKIFYQLIEQQIKTIMLAEVRDEYVLKVIDPAIVPEFKSSPKRSVAVALGIFIGLFFGVVIALINGYRK